MKRVYPVILIICGLGFGSIEPRPTAKQSGAVSTKTSVPFNTTTEKFWFLKYDGFKEDKVTIGKYSFDNFIKGEKGSQKRKFDSLGTRDFKMIQPPACVHLKKCIY